MKCTSCVSARPKSDDEELSPSPTMDKAEQEPLQQQQYRVESPPPPPLPERASRVQPAVSIVEVSPDHHGESSRIYKQPSPSPSSSSQLLRPLDVITEESSDVSDSENRPSPPRPDLCFPRPKARFKKPKSKNLLKNLLQLRQEPTTCVLVDAKIADSAGAEEYRSICTTEVVPEEILEVEVIDLGSNSSSLADLTDIDDLDGDAAEPDVGDDKINNNDQQSDNNNQAPPELQTNDDGNGNELRLDRIVEPVEFSEEDNNGYGEDFRESVKDQQFTQTPTPLDDALSAATTQNNDDDDDSDDDQCHDENDDRTESDRDDERSLLAGVDRASVVTQQPNAIGVKECTDGKQNDHDVDGASSSSDCCVTHSEQEEEEEEEHPAVIGDSGSTQSIAEGLAMVEEGSDEAARPAPPIPLPPPPAVAATSASATVTVAVTNLGQDEREGLPPTRSCENAKISSGSDTGEAGPADADQTGKEDSGDAVEIATNSSRSSGDSSVLLKILQEQPPSRPPPPSLPAPLLVEKRPTFESEQPKQISPASEKPSSLAAAGTKIERAAKSEQLNYEIVQDHRVLREETVTTVSTSSTNAGGSEVILRRKGNGRPVAENSDKEPSPEQKAALVSDLQNEISRIKDAELQEEFRKLELEAARIEKELNMMATTAISGAPPPVTENLTYYVSKQNDFAVERPAAPVQPRQKPPVVVAPVAPNPPPKPANSVAKSSSNDQLYNEWQQKMDEREARRLHKVIKITKSNDSNGHPEPIQMPPPPGSEDPNLGDEFLRKVKERRRKFTIPGGESDYESGASAPNSLPGTPIAGRKPIPKHIEAEFAEYAEIRKRQQQEDEREKDQQLQGGVVVRAVASVASHHQPQQPPPRPRHYINQAEAPPKAPPPKLPTSSVASSAPSEQQNGTNDAESVKVSALVEVYQQKQRQLLRQDSYKAAVKSVANSAEEDEDPDQQQQQQTPPVSVSAKCQEFERRLQRSASSDGRTKPVIPKQVKPVGMVASSSSSSVTAALPNRTGSYSDCDDVVPVNRNADNTRNALTESDNECARGSDDRSNTRNTVCNNNQGQSNRRSFSEADLLHEIDRALVLAKDFLFSRGVWSPHNRSTEILTKAELAERSRDQQQQQPPPQPVWTPRSAPPSPVGERREFRPIGFESPTPQRRNVPPTSTTPPPWTTSPGYDRPVEFSSNPPAAVVTSPSRPEPLITTGGDTITASRRQIQTSNSLPSIGGAHTVRFAPQSRQPAAPSPTINSLLKSKDGKIGQQVSSFESATNQSNVYQTSSQQQQRATTTTTTTHHHQQQQLQQQHQYQRTSSGTRLGRTTELSQPVRIDYLSEPEVDTGTQHRRTPTMAQLSPKKVDGIGPTTREGMPLTLRSEVDENNQAKWYKKMYQTLHKAHDDGYPYKSSGYQSEPEPNYDSDYTIKYSTLDRRRTPTALNPNSYSKFNTLQGSAIKSGSTQYRNQPGRIENYVPGHSSISEKESKEWWDEVMDIFNGQIEQQKLSNSKTYTEGNLSRALKEQGYDSDTTLIFRKKEPPASSALSPIEQKQHYKSMQAGGEIPVQGFRKPAPEKPKESPRRYIESDVNIHYKTPIRYEYKEAIPDDELAYRQAEHMRRVYQEERRRKYMHELEDLQNRRHTDTFTPSQKSPIPLNRYDDFDADLSPKPVNMLPRTIARALYNFQGQSVRELSFKKGDIIYLRRQIDKNWYEGEHNAMIGLLPANYIEILPRDGAKPLPKKPQREGKARAKFNFTAQTSVELSLLKGELVTLTRRVDDNWFEGRIGNKKGIFPVSYVEVLTDIGGEESYEIEPVVKPSLQTLQSHTLTTGYDNGLSNGRISPGIIRETKTVQKTEVLHVDTTNEPISYRALYNYKPQNSDELELLEGDVVYVLEKCDDGWYVGTSARTGCFGTFPGNYVKKL